MGTVFEGIRDDDQFRKTVAIKVLRTGGRSEAARRRFIQERQILAELEHPNIARLIDGGTADDGAPYIIMERVNGEPLIGYAAKHKLSIRDRLHLFRQIANAVQYAHQKLIVHRDLKPANILVSNEGVPKLLDFGIAKLLDAGLAGSEALTATGFHLMTPDYASPEQVQGKAITVASDVYSLGAVLYELLTGKRPHGLETYDHAEIAERVCLREIAAPSTTGVSALRGDLDTIVLKAMHKEPERRYNSADQFSEDIRRHLDGMPVLARPDSTAYRTRKFVGRHWIGLAATAAVLTALSTGIAVSMYQARLARERFELVRTLANRFLFDFHGEIVNLSGSTKAQQMVVNTAVEYLDKLSRTAGSDTALLQDLAEAYGKLGAVQGASMTSNGGRMNDALVSLRRSVDMYRKLIERDSSKRPGLARALLDTGNAEYRIWEYPQSLAHAREAAGILGNLIESGAKDSKLFDDAATAYVYMARSLREVGELDAAIQANRKAQVYLTSVAGANPLRLQFRRAVAQQDEGTLLTDTGRLEEAIEALTKVRSLASQVLAAQPENRAYQRFVFLVLGALADAHYAIDGFSIGDARKSARIHEERRAMARRLVDSDPADRAAKADLAIAESESSLPLDVFDPVNALRLAESGMRGWDAILGGLARRVVHNASAGARGDAARAGTARKRPHSGGDRPIHGCRRDSQPTAIRTSRQHHILSQCDSVQRLCGEGSCGGKT